MEKLSREDFEGLPDAYDGKVEVLSDEFPVFCAKALIKIETEFGSAAAFIITPDGYALTCAHAVAGNKDLSIIVQNKTARLDGEEDARTFEIVNLRSDLDLALIKIIPCEEMPYLELATEHRKIHNNEKCFWLGCQHGSSTYIACQGILSSKNGIFRNRMCYCAFGEEMPGIVGSPVISEEDGCVIGILEEVEPLKDDGSMSAMFMLPVSYFWKEFLQ